MPRSREIRSPQGVNVGSRRAGRGTAMLNGFNRYSTGLDSVIQPISRPSRDLLFYESRVGRQGTVRGVPGVGVGRNFGSVQSVLSNVTPFTVIPQEMLRPDIQQRISEMGFLRGRLSMAQRQSIIRKTFTVR